MGMLLMFALISLIVVVLVMWGTGEPKNAWASGTAAALVFSVITFCIVMTSYDNYVDARTFYDATKEQYSSSVEMYKDCAVLDLEGIAALAFTDYKYEGYQENMKDFIEKLRKSVIKYNENLIGKRIMDKNRFFNWLIVNVDDDMKVMKMK